MREQRFRAYLGRHIKTNGDGLLPKTIDEHVRKIGTVENRLGINVDTVFREGMLGRLHDRLEYSKEDADNRRPHREPRMLFTVGITGTANGYRNSINHYITFCRRDNT